MTTNARKTDAQRLGNGKKAFNVKQVEKMVEDAGGTEYTAGTGITISDSDVISADTSVLATKSELPDMTLYQEKLTAGTGIDITNNVISASGDWVEDTTYEWAKYATNNVTTKDLLFIAYTSHDTTSDIYNAVFIKSGTVINGEIDLPKRKASTNQLTLLTTVKLNEIVKDIDTSGVKARDTITTAIIDNGNIVFSTGASSLTAYIPRTSVKLFYKP